MTRNRSREAETEDVNQRRLRRGAVKRQHLSRWSVGHDEIAPGVIGPGHLQPEVTQTIIEHGAATGVGQLLIVSATAQSFASGGDYVTADTIVYQHGFEGVTAAGDSIVWPVDAVGEIQVEFLWDTYTGGGTVEIEVDGAVPAWGLVGSGEGSEGCKRRGVHINEGAVVKVKVTQSSGVAKTGDVLVEFSVPDPTLVDGPLSEALIETFWLDSRVEGTESSAGALEDARIYRVVVTGNYRWNNSAEILYGDPDPVAVPSPTYSSDNAEYDAETRYAGISAGTFPVHHPNFEINNGSGWVHQEPTGGPFTTPQAGHVYEYAVVGTGAVVQVRLVDSEYGDNNGQLKIEVFG